MASAVSTFLLCLVGYLVVVDAGQTVVKDLRKSTITGTNAGFLVNRDDCLRILQEKAPGMGLKLASDVGDRQYDVNLYSEILVSSVTVMDTTLSAEIDESTSSISAGGKVLFVALPVVSKGAIIDLVLAAYTDQTKPLAIPYFTNYEAVKRVNAITLSVSDNLNVVTIQDGADQIVLRIVKTPDCAVGDDAAISKDIRVTNYPDMFNWGCDMGDFSFCKKLDTETVNKDIGSLGPHVEGNVCTTMTTTRSRRCPVASATIDAITGNFLHGLPALVGTVPISAIEGELIVRKHNTGIIFPCIVKPKYRQKTLFEMWGQ